MFLRTTPRYSSKALNSNGFPRMDAASREATQTGNPLSILNRTDIRIDYARAWARRGHPFGSPRRSGSRKISSSCLLEFFEPDQRATIRGTSGAATTSVLHKKSSARLGAETKYEYQELPFPELVQKPSTTTSYRLCYTIGRCNVLLDLETLCAVVLDHWIEVRRQNNGKEDNNLQGWYGDALTCCRLTRKRNLQTFSSKGL